MSSDGKLVTTNSRINELADAALRATERGDYLQAKRLYAEALQHAPKHPTLLYNYASLARISGDLDLAEELLDQVIAVKPEDSAAWHLRSSLRRWDPQHNHIEELLSAINHLPKHATPRQRVELSYALAKEYEDCADYSNAKDWLYKGARLKRQHINYRINDDLQTITALTDYFKSPALSQADKPASSRPSGPCPIFIISLPRAGSTLLERMLSCDNKVTAGGELPYFPQLLGKALQQAFISANGSQARPGSKAELVGYASTIDWRQLGQNYLDKLPRQPFVIDKLPLNYLNIGFIRMALPQSRILYLQRDAADHELALMKHLFNQAYPWSYDVDEIKCYRQAVESLCDTVIAEPDSNIQRLSYEQLINSPEATLAKIADYCGLNWSERDIHQALQFADNNQQPSTTGSASQVRNPLHNRSIGLAKRYGWA